MMPDGSSNHVVSLKDSEMFDCLEKDFFSKGIDLVVKRTITRKFDFNLIMKTDQHQKTFFSISSGDLLMKMTAYNLKTVLEVAEYQTRWEAALSGRSLSNPEVREVPRNTSVDVNFNSFCFVYVDNFKNVFLPVLRVNFGFKDLRVSLLDTTDVKWSFDLDCNYNNSRSARWEPFVEPINFEFSYQKRGSASALMLNGLDSDGLYLNFTEELLEVLLHCVDNFRTVSKAGGLPGSVPALQQSELSEEKDADNEELLTYDSQFLVRNYTGYDIFVQTIGDRRGKVLRVKPMAERFVSFILEDEFSVKNNVNRKLLVTLEPRFKTSKRP